MMKNEPCVEQADRARSFDKDVPFTLEQVKRDSSSWSHAIFVVHGIGAHEAGVTAVGLRSGFEDAVELLRKSCKKTWQDMPATYIKEGYWGDYGDFKDNFPTLWNAMNKASQKYFKQLWKKRAESYTRTAIWYAGQSARLPWQALTNWSDVSGSIFHWIQEIMYRVLIRLPLYLLVIFVSWISLIALLVWPRGRTILSTVLGDVRLYVAPRGPGEQAIRQNIDIRVRDLFLQMLGLGFNPKTKGFEYLKPAGPCEEDPAGRKLLRVGDVRDQKFEKITWVSHSLGTVVSYNVIGDLLCQCQTIRGEKVGTAENEVTEAEHAERVKLVDRVEAGLHRFYTLGSPLRKIDWLFPNNMRPWPEDYFKSVITKKTDLPLDKRGNRDASAWWVNFRHIWDPVSGPVSRSQMFRWAGDWHSPEILTLPGVAHVGYWHTNAITKYILSQAHPDFPGNECAKLPRWPQNPLVKIVWQLSMMFFLVLVAAIAVHVVQLVGGQGIHYAAPWWKWLVTVPVLGPILQLLSCWASKVLCGIEILGAFIYHWAACLSTQFWNWLSKLCSF